MRTHLALAGCAALLSPVLAPLHAGDPYRLETRLYVYQAGTFHQIAVSGKALTDAGRSTILQSPGVAAFDQVRLALDGATLAWNGGQVVPRQFSPSGAPVVAAEAGRPVTIVASASVQYLERQPDGSLRVREIPADSPEAPHCRMTFTLGAPTDAAGDLPLACQVETAAVRSRTSIPGVALPVGRPLLAVSTEDLAFAARANTWTALFLRAPADSEYRMLLLLKVVPRGAPEVTLAKVADLHLLSERFGAAAVAAGNYVYIVGGKGDDGILGDIERLDVRTHEITRLTNALIPRHHHGAALVGGKIYVFGGESYRLPHQINQYEGSMQIYDLASGRISRGPPMPTARTDFATAVVDGKIYAIGGTQMVGIRSRQTDVTEAYDPATGAWAQLAPMPTARDSRAAAGVDDCILVFGGRRWPSSAGLKTVEGYIPEQNRWYRLPDLGEGVSANSAAALGNEVYLFGNFDPADEVLAYDLDTHATTVFKRGFIPASQTAAVALDGLIYVIGGTGGGGHEWNGRGVAAMDDIQVFARPGETDR